MSIAAEYTNNTKVWYQVPYAVPAYTYPKEALIASAHIDDACVHIMVMDGRMLSIPLHWLPAVLHASPEDRCRFTFSEDRRALIWDPDNCSINDELFVDDYLAPHREPEQ